MHAGEFYDAGACAHGEAVWETIDESPLGHEPHEYIGEWYACAHPDWRHDSNWTAYWAECAECCRLLGKAWENDKTARGRGIDWRGSRLPGVPENLDEAVGEMLGLIEA